MTEEQEFIDSLERAKQTRAGLFEHARMAIAEPDMGEAVELCQRLGERVCALGMVDGHGREMFTGLVQMVTDVLKVRLMWAEQQPEIEVREAIRKNRAIKGACCACFRCSVRRSEHLEDGWLWLCPVCSDREVAAIIKERLGVVQGQVHVTSKGPGPCCSCAGCGVMRDRTTQGECVSCFGKRTGHITNSDAWLCDSCKGGE